MFDYLLFMIPPFLLSMWASWKTRSAFKKYSRELNSTGLTGAQAARIMLDQAGLRDVEIHATRGYLSDHYNPMNRTLALSEAVYSQPTVAAVGVACHEAGHAIQHAKNYGPLWLRSALVPTASFGSNAGMFVVIAGFLMSSAGLVTLGALLFSAVFLFQVVTLPVEFDASARAKKLAYQFGLVREQERVGVDKVLNAAALTYVAAAVSSLMTVIYYLLQASAMSRD